jgi:hypothetical protein
MSLHLGLLQRSSPRHFGRLPARCVARAVSTRAAFTPAASSDADPSTLREPRVMTGLGALVGTIAMPETTERAAAFTGKLPVAQSIGSYNWLTDRAEPTIAVPGTSHCSSPCLPSV